MIWCQCVELKFNLAMLDGVHNMIWCHLGGTGGSLMVLYNGYSSRTWLLMCIVWSTMYLIGQKISSDKEYLDNLQQLPLANSVNRTNTVWSLTDHLMVLSLVALFTEVWCPPMPMWLYVCVRVAHLDLPWIPERFTDMDRYSEGIEGTSIRGECLWVIHAPLFSCLGVW